MVQVNKAEVGEPILGAEAELFAKHGYARATINQIAKTAGMAPSNVYFYFKSKLEIMFAVYEPWFRRQIEQLSRDVAGMRSPASESAAHRSPTLVWIPSR